MNENPLKDLKLKPTVIILSQEDYDRLLAVLDEEPTDEELARLAELLARPQRIKSGRYELR